MRLIVFALALCAAVPAQPRLVPAVPENLSQNLPAQPIGRNDLLMVSVYDAPELSRSVRVSSEGIVRLPMLNARIKAEGLLPADLEEAIAKALDEEGVLVQPVVTVTIAEYHSRPISVAGAVRTPLTFQAIGRVTLLEALARAGGLDKEAASEILVTIPNSGTDPSAREAASTLRVSTKSLFEGADPASNIILHGGEEIRVPEAGRIFVVGNVKKPGVFVPQDSAEGSVLKAVAVAEGLLPFTAKNAYIYRPKPSGEKQEIAVDLQKIVDRKSPDVALLPNDVLYIPDNKNKKMGFAALERILLFGSTAGATALVYSNR